MLSLLRCEWYQARKSLSLRIAIVIIVVTSVMFGVRLTSASEVARLEEIGMTARLYGGSSICSAMEDGAMGLLLASLFAGWMIGGSFENRVIQESVSYGKKRSAVYLAKMIMYSLVVTVLCLLYWCATAAPAGIKNGMGTEEICGNLLASMVPENIAKIIRYTPLALYTHVTKTDVTWFDIWQTVGISIIWIILFGMAGYLKFRKTELK